MTLSDAIQSLIGASLSSVEFVQDYVQLRFDGPCLTAYTHPRIRTHAELLSWNGPGYRDALCSQIGQPVESASVNSEELLINFKDLSVSVSLLSEDYEGPEALQFSIEEREIWVA
jgi:hypothetical protein